MSIKHVVRSMNEWLAVTRPSDPENHAAIRAWKDSLEAIEARADAPDEHYHGPWLSTNTPGVLKCAGCGHEEDCRAEASADALDVEALRNMFKGISLPPGPDFAWVEAHRPFIEAALETIDRWEAEARADVLDVLRELTRAASEYADSTGGISGDLGARLFDARVILAKRKS